MTQPPPKFIQELVKWFPTGVGGSVAIFFATQQQWLETGLAAGAGFLWNVAVSWGTGFSERMTEGAKARGRQSADLLLKHTDTLPEKLNRLLTG